MDQVAGYLGNILKPRYEEDGIDKLNYQITGWLLIAFSITLSAKEYVGMPLQCWMPAQFTDHWSQYVHDYCLVENTYYLPWERNIGNTTSGERTDREIKYYQWVPFVLALMALLFTVPHFIWRSLNFLSGLPVRSLVSMGKMASDMQQGEERRDVLTQLSKHIHDAVELQTSFGSGNPLSWLFSCGKQSGLYVCFLYILTKLLFLANLVLQYHILNFFIGPGHDFWGIHVLRDLIHGRDWNYHGQFPRVTLCDFDVRILGQTQKFSVQCVLMINMFNEKIFLFLWWWFLLVGVLTLFSLLRWLVVCFVPQFQESFIKRMLNTHGLPRDRNNSKIRPFVRHLLKSDGVFVLRLMTSNAGELVTSQVVASMWRDFVEAKEKAWGDFGQENTRAEPSSPTLDSVDAHKPSVH